jgi:hypothetical protein
MSEKQAIYKKKRTIVPNKVTSEMSKNLTELSKKLKQQVILDKKHEDEYIYISGKVTGEEMENCRAKFKTAEKYLKELFPFAKIINPVEEIIKEYGIDIIPEWKICMRFLLSKMLRPECTAVYFLKDYTESNGAIMEHYNASKLNYELIFQ